MELKGMFFQCVVQRMRFISKRTLEKDFALHICNSDGNKWAFKCKRRRVYVMELKGMFFSSVLFKECDSYQNGHWSKDFDLHICNSDGNKWAFKCKRRRVYVMELMGRCFQCVCTKNAIHTNMDTGKRFSICGFAIQRGSSTKWAFKCKSMSRNWREWMCWNPVLKRLLFIWIWWTLDRGGGLIEIIYLNAVFAVELQFFVALSWHS
jgi:hypothetical protein